MDYTKRAEYASWYYFKKTCPCTFPEFMEAVGRKPNRRYKLRLKDPSAPKSLTNVHWVLVEPEAPREMDLGSEYDDDPLMGKTVGGMQFAFPVNHTMWNVMCLRCWGISYLLRPSDKHPPYCCYCDAPPTTQRGVTKRERASKKARVARIKRLLGTNETSEAAILREWENLKLINKRDRLRAKYKADKEKLRAKR